MTLRLYASDETVLAERAARDLEEACWMWQSLCHAVGDKRTTMLQAHLHAAYVAFRNLSEPAQDKLADVFRAGYAAGLAREKELQYLAELARARRVLAACEEDMRRTRGDERLSESHASAVRDQERWRAKVAELEGRAG